MNRDNRVAFVPKTVHKSASYTMLPDDDILFTDSSGGAITITLPRLADVIGKLITIQNLAGTNNVVLAVPGNEATNYATIEGLDIDAVGDRLVLRSNGRAWEVIENAIA